MHLIPASSTASSNVNLFLAHTAAPCVVTELLSKIISPESRKHKQASYSHKYNLNLAEVSLNFSFASHCRVIVEYSVHGVRMCNKQNEQFKESDK